MRYGPNLGGEPAQSCPSARKGTDRRKRRCKACVDKRLGQFAVCPLVPKRGQTGATGGTHSPASCGTEPASTPGGGECIFSRSDRTHAGDGSAYGRNFSIWPWSSV